MRLDGVRAVLERMTVKETARGIEHILEEADAHDVEDLARLLGGRASENGAAPSSQLDHLRRRADLGRLGNELAAFGLDLAGIAHDEDRGLNLDQIRATARAAIERLNEVSDASADSDDDLELVWPTLRLLDEHPELFAPPVEQINRLTWRERATLLSGSDKSGKSTLAAHAVSRLTTGGDWFGQRLELGYAVVAAPDEAYNDTVRRLYDFGADLDRVRVLRMQPPDLFASLDRLLEKHPADVTVIDSVTEWARLTVRVVPADGDNAGWSGVLRPLVGMICRKRKSAMLALHHPRRSDEQYRGAGEIAASVDCLWEMTKPEPGEDPTLRRFRGRARWTVEPWSLRMVDDRYTLGVGGPMTLDARILADLAASPGVSRSAQRARLEVNKKAYLATVRRLLELGHLTESSGRLYLPSDLPGELL